MNFFSNLALLSSVDTGSMFSVIFTCLYVVELSETAWLKNKQHCMQMYQRRVLIQWL